MRLCRTVATEDAAEEEGIGIVETLGVVFALESAAEEGMADGLVALTSGVFSGIE